MAENHMREKLTQIICANENEVYTSVFVFNVVFFSTEHCTNDGECRNTIDVRGDIVAQWIRPQTLNCEVSSLNLLAAAVVPLGKVLYLYCLGPRKGLNAVRPPVACLFAAFLMVR